MSARPNYHQKSPSRNGTSCQFSKRYRESVVFITINNVKAALNIAEDKINESLNPLQQEGRIAEITQNWNDVNEALSNIEYAYSTYVQSVYRVRPTTFIFFTTNHSLANASQMFTNYLVAHKITHEHYRKNPIDQQHWIMKHTIHRPNELRYYSEYIDHIYNTGTGQLL